MSKLKYEFESNESTDEKKMSLENAFTTKMISSVSKSSFLKKHSSGSAESKCC